MGARSSNVTPWRGTIPQRHDVIDLMGLILQQSVPLRDAACRGLGPMFDPDDPQYDPGTAMALCLSCPCLQACRAWAEGMPRTRLSGVVAGEVRRPVVTNGARHRP